MGVDLLIRAQPCGQEVQYIHEPSSYYRIKVVVLAPLFIYTCMWCCM